MVTTIEEGSIVMSGTVNDSTINHTLSNRNEKYILKSDRK